MPTFPKKDPKSKRKTIKKMVQEDKAKVLTTFIKKTVNKLAETKQTSFTIQSAVVAYTNAGWNALNCFPITPYSGYIDIVQGTGQGARTGNEIRVKKSIVDIVIWPQGQSATLNLVPKPLEVIIWILKLNNTDAKPATLGAFFNVGNASVDPSGTLLDLVRPYNTDVWTVYKRIVRKLGTSEYFGTGAIASRQYYANNDYKYNHIIKIDVTKYLPTKTKYNDTTAIPFSQSVMLAIQVVNADGTPQVGVDGPAEMYYNQTFDYHDI